MQPKTHTVKKITENVFMENEIRNLYNLFTPKIKAALRPYIGQKAVKSTDGRFVKPLAEGLKTITNEAYKAAINPLPGTKYVNVHVFMLSVSYSSIWLKISACFEGRQISGGGYIAEYYEESYYIGQVDPGTVVLKEVKLDEVLPPVDLSAEMAAYNEADKAIKKAEKENGKLLPRNRLF